MSSEHPADRASPLLHPAPPPRGQRLALNTSFNRSVLGFASAFRALTQRGNGARLRFAYSVSTSTPGGEMAEWLKALVC